jgi:hypothetical protein
LSHKRFRVSANTSALSVAGSKRTATCCVAGLAHGTPPSITSQLSIMASPDSALA